MRSVVDAPRQRVSQHDIELLPSHLLCCVCCLMPAQTIAMASRKRKALTSPQVHTPSPGPPMFTASTAAAAAATPVQLQSAVVARQLQFGAAGGTAAAAAARSHAVAAPTTPTRGGATSASVTVQAPSSGARRSQPASATQWTYNAILQRQLSIEALISRKAPHDRIRILEAGLPWLIIFELDQIPPFVPRPSTNAASSSKAMVGQSPIHGFMHYSALDSLVELKDGEEAPPPRLWYGFSHLKNIVQYMDARSVRANLVSHTRTESFNLSFNESARSRHH